MKAKQRNFSGETINYYTFIKLIGQGNWADIYMAIEERKNKMIRAIKVISLKKFEEIPKLK